MPQAAASEAGSCFGKYFLMKKLAAGGMGEIFLAKQQGPAGFQKILVVKKILPHLTENKEFIEAFLGEARLAAQMNHRNVVQVFELGQEGSAYFIAMEYVQGKSLRDVIDAAARRKEKLHPELCRSIAEQICDGASYAHNLTDITGRSLNLVHRDLNPQNVLISYTGDVKVIDFGIAKSEMSTVKTEAGMIKGKFVYMSPEQSLAKKLDKRSDIFAIGISLYEMLTGSNPFHKNNIVLTLEAVQRYEPPPPSQHDPSYAPFDPIVARALAKDRDRRYSDASEMQDDLRRVVVPRPPERLGQFMARLFRAQLEEEQQMLMDSDQLKVTGSGPKKAPGRAGQTPPRAVPAPTATMPDVQPGLGTELLSGIAARRPGAAPKAAPVRTPAPSLKPGAGDTLIDMSGSSSDEVPGGTAMLKPGLAPPLRKGAAPDEILNTSATQMLAGPSRAPGKKPQKTPPPIAPTKIMTLEESEAAAQEALQKLEDARRGVVKTRTRDDKRKEMAQGRKSGKSLWIALGVGSALAAAGVIAVLMYAFADDASQSARRAKKTQVQAAQLVPEIEKKVEPPAAPPTPEKAPAPEQRAEEARPKPAYEAPVHKPGAGKAHGVLTLNPGPNVPVVFGGTPFPRQVGAYNLPLTAQSGSILVGDASSPFKLQLDYALSSGAMSVRVNAIPSALATLNGHELGKTPVTEARIEKATLELKKPGSDAAMTVRLAYKPN